MRAETRTQRAETRLKGYGPWLRWQRERRGWTQEYLGRLMRHGDTTTISRWENGERYPSLDEALELAEILQTRVDAFLSGAGAGQVVHYHVAGEVQVSVLDGGMAVFGAHSEEDLERWMHKWRAMRNQAPGTPDTPDDGPIRNPGATTD